VTQVLSEKLRAANARLREHRAARTGRPVPPQARAHRAAFDWRPFLQMLAFFDGFDRWEIDELTQGCAVFELERGARLFSAGEPAAALSRHPRRGRDRRAQGRLGAARHHRRAGRNRRLPRGARAPAALGLGEDPRVRVPAWSSARRSSCATTKARAGTSVSLRRAIHRSLLQALARTNTQLIRLISHARLNAERGEAEALEKALHGQIVFGDS
jgi:hypothetical protein